MSDMMEEAKGGQTLTFGVAAEWIYRVVHVLYLPVIAWILLTMLDHDRELVRLDNTAAEAAVLAQDRREVDRGFSTLKNTIDLLQLQFETMESRIDRLETNMDRGRNDDG